MDNTYNDSSSELECVVTVYDGSWMTCDMIEEAQDD
jgi:hypothetical protein